jgi:CRISPR/Cas system-associated endoribonuclease Cas2
MLALEIKETVKENTDCVFIIPSCKECFTSKDITGHFDEEKVKHKEFLILSNAT